MPRVVLLGGGHSHIEVLRRAASEPLPAELVLVEPNPGLPYTGMVPGFVAGAYQRPDITIDLTLLCRRAGCVLISTRAAGLDPRQRHLHCEDDSVIEYDLLSIDVGSVLDMSVPGATQHAVPVRPLWHFIDAWPRIAAARHSVGIVGTGAAGVELALAIDASTRRLGLDATVSMIGEAPELAAELPTRARRLLAHTCAVRGIRMHTGTRAARVTGEGVITADDRIVPARTVLWATGPAAPPWLRDTGLPLDDRGFLAIDRHLRSLDHPHIFAAGDAAGIAGKPRPKSGVYAVRQAPLLFENLRQTLLGGPLRAYEPQRRALALIGTGDGHAVGVYGRITFEGAWAWRWKQAIDRKFVARYRADSQGIR